MAKKLQGTLYLCLGVNGLNTSMEKVIVTLEKPKGKEQFLKEKGGKRKFAFDEKFFFKAESKGKMGILGFMDRDTLLPLNPREVMTGLEFSRTEIKNAISYQLDAERELRARYKSQSLDTATKVLAIMLIVTGILFVAGGSLWAQAISHPVITTYVQAGPPPNTSKGGGIGAGLSNVANSLFP